MNGIGVMQGIKEGLLQCDNVMCTKEDPESREPPYCTVQCTVDPSSTISSAHLLMAVTQSTIQPRGFRNTFKRHFVIRMLPREEDNIVCTWLRFLHVEEYSSNFLDNGYDDLETVKQMTEEDLRAIGISSAEDEEIILISVKILREQGAAWVYFLSGDRDLSVSSSSVKMSDDLSSVSSRSDHHDPLRRRLEDMEHFSMCENIYCDIAEIPEHNKGAEKLNEEQEANSWAEFWRKFFYTKKKRKNVIKRGDF